MKIIIVTQEDPFYLPVFFQRFFELLAEEPAEMGQELDIVGIIVQVPLGRKSTLALAKRMLDLFGWYYFTLKTIRYVLWKIVRRLYLWRFLPRSSSIEYFARRNRIEVLPFTDMNSEECLHFLREEGIDLIVSAAASQIFKQAVLEAPRCGCINIHNAPLPDYRGMMPNFWQMYHGEKLSVMTIHEMVEKLDQGRIILQRETPIEEGMTLDELIRETKRVNAEGLLDALRMFVQNTVEYRALSNREGSYFSFPRKEDVREFKNRGYRVV